MTTIEYVTNAPEAYDGFGTETVEAILHWMDRGMHTRYRRVRILEEHLDWQTARYRSGMYGAMTPEEWLKFREQIAIPDAFS